MPVGRTPFLVAKPERVSRLDRIQVLVIHSSDKAGELIKNIFQQIGFKHVVTAQTAAEAVFAMRQMRIDIILLDSHLYTSKDSAGSTPGWESIRGVDFIKRLRHASNAPSRFAPIIMLADGVTREELVDARDAGVNEVIMKPLNAEEFCARVVQVFDRPRNFVTAPAYKGPCRRRVVEPSAIEIERRIREVRLIRHESYA